MLRDKRAVSACGIISCRIRAEALARAFNTRLWPCSWMPQRSPEGVSGGAEDEDEFFEASPSPEDESPLRQHHESAATEAGREKLYELLQQHAGDDAIDVFYDVSEDAGLADSPGSTCGVVSKRAACDGPKCLSAVVVDEPTSQNPDGRLNGNLSFGGGASSDQSIAESNGIAATQADIDEIPDDTLAAVEAPNFCDRVPVNGLDSHEASSSFLENSRGHEGIDHDISETNCDSLKDAVERDSANPSSPCVDQTVCNQLNPPLRSNASLSDIERCENKNACPQVRDLPFALPVETIELDNDNDNLSSIDAVESVGQETSQDVSHDAAVSIQVSRTSTPSPDYEAKSPTSSRLQVFEESRPTISRSTSLKTGKTPPGTPGRKKMVRFADVLGLDLEDVRHIMTGDVPVIPSSAYTDLNLNGTDFGIAEQAPKTVKVNRSPKPSWSNFQDIASTVGLHPAFPIPGEQPDFMERIRTQGICLESVLVTDMCIQCTCRVANTGYHKKVTVRYTVDDWLSTNDVDAVYVAGSSRDDMDQFRFSIFLSASNRCVQFAIKYVVNGREHWDNNRSQNYCLGYRGHDVSQHVPGSSWTHQFW